MKVKFNDSDNFIKLDSYVLYQDKVDMQGQGITENLSGFILYEDDEETIVRDCSEYKHKWNIYTERENGIVLTESETDRERKPNPDAEKPVEIVDVPNNEELAECIADLMYELSASELGLQGEV